MPPPDPAAARAFVIAQTIVAAPPLVPELRLSLATEVTPLWQATEQTLAAHGLPPPFWAFAWAGGQALARHLLDTPGLAAGRRVLDFAAGSGIAGLAAARAGAALVTASEIDAFAIAALSLNAEHNGLPLETVERDLVGAPLTDIDLVLGGDVCYEQPMAGWVTAWLGDLARAGVEVLLGDPGRSYLPSERLVPLARYRVPTSRELEDTEQRDTTVWRLMP